MCWKYIWMSLLTCRLLWCEVLWNYSRYLLLYVAISCNISRSSMHLSITIRLFKTNIHSRSYSPLSNREKKDEIATCALVSSSFPSKVSMMTMLVALHYC